MNAYVAKCLGRVLDEVCSRREECSRYTTPAAPMQTWLLPAATFTGWMCREFTPSSSPGHATPAQQPAAPPSSRQQP